MSDFFQNGVIATLHRLGRPNPDALEERLIEHARGMPTALVIPCLISELDGPALGRIVQILAENQYLGEIVIALDRAERRDFERARRFFEVLGPRARIVWIDGPRMRDFIHQLQDSDLDIGSHGKGRATWLAIGCVLGGHCGAMVLHDADVLTYDRTLLARLCYPIMDQSLGYEYVKGYYSRVTDQLHGRVTRLFLTPLIRALVQLVGSIPFLRYMDSFRYALAGEFARSAFRATGDSRSAFWRRCSATRRCAGSARSTWSRTTITNTNRCPPTTRPPDSTE
jgi:glucosyl-3-phosphoglycerate synthase